ncbi:MAG: hypothetical protein D6682_02055 [Zetaproteobacteria bacterium]|nr:MAG: hypothetical protein D6682_02055 [Zetaproteobacteria bacterium]
MSDRPDPDPRLARLVHELNNLWGALLGGIEMAQMELDPDAPAQEWLQGLGETIDAGVRLTEELRAIARGDPPPQETSERPSPPPARANDPDEDDRTLRLDAQSIRLTNETLERELRRICALVEQLEQSRTPEERRELVDRLIPLAMHHFYREEQLMHRCPEYPFAASHYQTHCALLTRLKQLQRRLAAGDDPAGIRELTELLPVHIVGMDATLAPYLQRYPELSHFDCPLPPDEVLEHHFRLPRHQQHLLLLA